MIEFKHVTKSYRNGHDALKRVNIKLNKGEMAFLTGHSGAGKSTILKLLLAYEQATSGQILVNNKDITSLTSKQIPLYRQKLGMVYQDHKLLADHTVFENVALPLVVQGVHPDIIAERVEEALTLVDILPKSPRYPTTLSSGEQQRVGIARGIVHRPDVLLADEPTGNLDPGLSKEIMRLFARLNDTGMTILIASHDLALIARMRYAIIALKHGRLLQDFAAEEEAAA